MDVPRARLARCAAKSLATFAAARGSRSPRAEAPANRTHPHPPETPGAGRRSAESPLDETTERRSASALENTRVPSGRGKDKLPFSARSVSPVGTRFSENSTSGMPRGRLAQPDSESFRIPISAGFPRHDLSESGKPPIAGAKIRPLAPRDLGRWYSVSASKMSAWAGVYKQLGLTAHCGSTRYTMKPFLREMACLQWPECGNHAEESPFGDKSAPALARYRSPDAFC